MKRHSVVVGLLAFTMFVFAYACGGDNGSVFTADAGTGPGEDDASNGNVDASFVLESGTNDSRADVVVDCDATPSLCLPPGVCGDGKPGLGESCDDGNTNANDGCSPTCQIEAPFWACTFGQKCVDVRDCAALLDAGLADAAACVPPTKAAVCGDGVLDPGELCDDHNTTANDGCAADCKSVEANWVCPTPGSPCVSTMVCGDGKITGTEQCDDKNTTGGDGCSATCQKELGWKCLVPGIACVADRCGDGYKAGAEQCDDGNTNDNDGCSSTCRLQAVTTTVAPTSTTPGKTSVTNYDCSYPPGVTHPQTCAPTNCGNGAPEGTEQCDDGNNVPLDGCDPFCRLEPTCPNGTCVAKCGDGLLFDFDTNGDGQADEQCDDGNTTTGDGCSSTCQIESGYACTVQAAAFPQFIDVPVIYRDFKFYNAGDPLSHPDFERYACNQVTEDLTQTNLVNGVPVFRYNGTGNDPVTGTDMNGTCRNNGATPDASQQLTSALDFTDWYADVDVPVAGNRRSKKISDQQIRLTRTGTAGNYSYVFDSNTDLPYSAFSPVGFWPIDNRGWGNQGVTTGLTPNNVSHNFSFTTEFRYWFTYDSSTSPQLDFSGDDDVWVFINGKLALDLGGLHPRIAGSFVLDATKAAALGLVNNHVYEIALFHAERHTGASNFKLTMRGFLKRSSVCANVCGDGIKTSQEQCDNGTANTNSGAYGSCKLDCTLGPYCGDAVPTIPPEQCDDGVNLSSYAQNQSSTACAPGCVKPPFCGDGQVQGNFGEQCDNGTSNTNSGYGQCRTDCTRGPRCGDGQTQAQFGEQCDDGFNVTTYVQNPTGGQCGPGCKTPAYCGDGIQQLPMEQCDNGNQNSSSGAYGSCSTTCTLGPRCGDGIVQTPQEQCDDGNRTNGDGCSAACLNEAPK